MTCELSGYAYSWDCSHCMVRKIKNMRIPGGKASRDMQEMAFKRMGPSMAAKVKEELKNELQTG